MYELSNGNVKPIFIKILRKGGGHKEGEGKDANIYHASPAALFFDQFALNHQGESSHARATLGHVRLDDVGPRRGLLQSQFLSGEWHRSGKIG